MIARYTHQVPFAEDVDTGVRRCRVCGERTTGIGATLRHWGEAVRPTVPDRIDIAALNRAVRVAVAAQQRLIGAVGSDEEDTARVIVEALYASGALRTGRAAWRRPARAA